MIAIRQSLALCLSLGCFWLASSCGPEEDIYQKMYGQNFTVSEQSLPTNSNDTLATAGTNPIQPIRNPYFALKEQWRASEVAINSLAWARNDLFLSGIPFYCNPLRYSVSFIVNLMGCAPFLEHIFSSTGSPIGPLPMPTTVPPPFPNGVIGGDFFDRIEDNYGCYRPYSRYRSARNDICV